jgi:hypothetical protein
MDEKVHRLLQEVERLLLQIQHSIPPEVLVVERVRKLMDDIRQDARERVNMSEDKPDHWHTPETDKPEKEPGPYAQDKSREPPGKQRQEAYEESGEAGRATAETFKK